MAEIYLVGHDGRAGGTRAAEFALQRAKLCRGGVELRVAFVIEWSPYSFLTPEELAERHREKENELRRAFSAVIEPLLVKIRAAGVTVEGIARHGHAAQILCELARELPAVQIFVGRHGDSELHARVFGSVPGTLVQISPVPVTVVP